MHPNSWWFCIHVYLLVLLSSSLCYFHVSHVFGQCKPWWWVISLLKHLNIVINGRLFFSIEVIYIPVLCTIKIVCYISVTKYYSYCSIWQKALANYICLKYNHTKFRIFILLYSISGKYLNTFPKLLLFAFLINTMSWNVDSSNVFLTLVTQVLHILYF